MAESTPPMKAPAFQLSPDPRFYYGSRSHSKAMAYLQYGVRQAEGFIVITGEVGAGKSLLVSKLLDQLDRNKYYAAQVVTSNLDADNMLRSIMSAFQLVPKAQDKASQIDAFKHFLLQVHRSNKRALLIVDEAQNLSKEAIEELRMLSNFCLAGKSLFQSFLVGQPQFKALLSDPDLEQLRQRVIASYHLEPLSRNETRDYVLHRLKVAGWTGSPSFSDEAFARIFEESDGVPRKINMLCSRIMLLTSMDKLKSIDTDIVEEVVKDLQDEVAYSGGAAPAATASAASAAIATPNAPAAAAPAPVELAKNWAAEAYTAALARMEAIDERLASIEAKERVSQEMVMRKLTALEARLSALGGRHISPQTESTKQDFLSRLTPGGSRDKTGS